MGMLGHTTEIRQGTLDLLMLRALATGPQHGWGIAQWLELVSRETLRVHQGSIYPALHRLERAGLVQSEWQVSENNRRARVYSLTAAGHRRLADEIKDWHRFAEAVGWVLQGVET
jgi:transcriptional regulator